MKNIVFRLSIVKPHNSKKYNILTTSLLLALIAFFSFSCNEQPTAIGSSFITDTINIVPINNSVTKLIASTQPKREELLHMNNGGLLIGSINDSTKAMACMRFDLPDTFPYIKAEDIVSAKFTLFLSNYLLGDIINPFLSFKVFKAKNIYELNATWDTLYNLIDYTSIVGYFSSKIDINVAKEYEIELDKNMVAQWLRWQADTSKLALITGILLVPDGNSNVIARFDAQELGIDYYPNILTINYNNSGTITTIKCRAGIEGAVSTAPFPSEPITIQAGVSYRTALDFDFSSLPGLISIHKASLELTLNMEKSQIGTTGLDSVIALNLYVDTVKEKDYGIYYYGFRQSGTNKFIFPSISSAVEKWMRQDKKGRMILHIQSTLEKEYLRTDKLVFYGLNDPEPVRPKLNIIYSTRPGLNCNNK
ncbi:MAG: hypothetical protein HW421_2884 [Ignavibacteria bacterium]|nr:hypothetical protein [Ignavibacteria bacterium]